MAPPAARSLVNAGQLNGGSGHPLSYRRASMLFALWPLRHTAPAPGAPRHIRALQKKERLPAILPGAVALHSLVKKRKQTHDANVYINNTRPRFLVRSVCVKFSARRANSSHSYAGVELLALCPPHAKSHFLCSSPLARGSTSCALSCGFHPPTQNPTPCAAHELFPLSLFHSQNTYDAISSTPVQLSAHRPRFLCHRPRLARPHR